MCPHANSKYEIHAVAELKKSDPSNSILKKFCVPAVIGGDVGVILGIRYKNIGPKAIHSFESGLTIYSINLETHDPEHNAAIGGPHFSLSAMLSQVIHLSDVDPDRLEKIIHKDPQHYLPWRTVFKPDTKRRSDGTDSRSLNDLLCKGCIKSNNFLRMILRFSIGTYAFSGDLH